MDIQTAKTEIINTDESLLCIEEITRDFGNGRGIFGTTLKVRPGKVVAVIGANGSGKSTLLRCTSFFEPIDHGVVNVCGRAYPTISNNGHWQHFSMSDVSSIRGRYFAVAFQNSQPWPHLNVQENIMLPLTQQNVTKEKARDRCNQVLAELGLIDRSANRPWELSGGLRQRVVLARTLALDTPLIFLDEATSSLDPDWTERVRLLIQKKASEGKGLLVVSHQMGFVRRVADEVIFLDSGSIRERGNPVDIFSNPISEELQRFLSNA